METKPGIYTTEFLVHNVLQILLALNTFHIWTYLPPRLAWASVLAQALLGAAYTISRGNAKSGKSFDPAAKNNYTLLPKKKDATKRV